MFLAKVLIVVVVAGTLVVVVELKAAVSVVEAGEVEVVGVQSAAVEAELILPWISKNKTKIM